jgi:hypothetical protein
MYTKIMAFALSSWYMGSKHYIHREFGLSENSSSTTRNMNFALLFHVESDARKWAKKHEVVTFTPEFIPMQMKELPSYEDKLYYQRLRDLKVTVKDDLPF